MSYRINFIPSTSFLSSPLTTVKSPSNSPVASATFSNDVLRALPTTQCQSYQIYISLSIKKPHLRIKLKVSSLRKMCIITIRMGHMRHRGIEPPSKRWERLILPLYQCRKKSPLKESNPHLNFTKVA